MIPYAIFPLELSNVPRAGKSVSALVNAQDTTPREANIMVLGNDCQNSWDSLWKFLKTQRL